MTDKKDIVDELHRSARKNFTRVSFDMRGIDDTFQIDLIEFIPYASVNNQNRYALVVIDTFSKYAWTVPIKNKTGIDVTKAMKSVFEQSARVCKNLQSDNGKEFYNKHFAALMQKYRVNHYSTFSKMKASICERLNRTLLNKLWKRLSLNGNHKWVNVLKQVTREYNETKHSKIKMKPSSVCKANEQYLLDNIYKINHTFNVSAKVAFKIGNNVRISKYKTIFEKSYTRNWSTEIFVIDKVLSTEPTTFLLRDLHGHQIQGAFHSYEMQKTSALDVYLVEKIIRRKGNRCLVKWLGFDDTHNSWIDKTDIV